MVVVSVCKDCKVQMQETKPMHFVCPACHKTFDYTRDINQNLREVRKKYGKQNATNLFG